MTTYLLYGDSLHSLEVRHEIGEPLLDPVVFIDDEDKRIVAGSHRDQSVLSAREDVVDEFVQIEELGYDEIESDTSFPEELIGPEIVLRVVSRVGATAVSVPASFPVIVADHLRDKGVDVVVDAAAWSQRRRRKTPGELEGIERAQRAAETAMLTAGRMLREAEPTASGGLRFEGEELTAELVREAMIAQLVAQGAECDEILVHSGDAFLLGHDVGRGPIVADQSCIVDCYPRDRRSGAYTDMTRTFAPGRPSEELKRLHAHCRAALDIAMDAISPGAGDVHAKVSEYFRGQGFPTIDDHDGAKPLMEGFTHGVGHGVGLQVHERPWMGRRADELVDGDVIAIEPGLYFRGVGGVRLEDTVLVTDGGVERFTDPYPYDLEP